MNDCNKLKNPMKGQMRENIHTDNIEGPVSFRVRIDYPHPLECRRRQLNRVVLWMRQENPTAGLVR